MAPAYWSGIWGPQKNLNSIENHLKTILFNFFHPLWNPALIINEILLESIILFLFLVEKKYGIKFYFWAEPGTPKSPPGLLYVYLQWMTLSFESPPKSCSVYSSLGKPQFFFLMAVPLRREGRWRKKNNLFFNNLELWK